MSERAREIAPLPTRKTILIMEYQYNPSETECKAIFAASCIESVASALAIPSELAYQRLTKVNMIEDYILYCYDTLHTESRSNLTDDLIRTLEIWEKKKGIVKC